MKPIATFALMLNLGVAALNAQQRPVSMTFSGTAGASAIDLQQPNTTTGEDNYGGRGSLGRFTYREVRATLTSPQRSATCSGPTQLFFASKSGAGVFRFRDGSLLKVTLTQGGDCIDFVALRAHCTRSFQVVGGTGRFRNASGTLAVNEIVVPVLADASNKPVFFASTGDIDGTISGVVAAVEERRDQSR